LSEALRIVREKASDVDVTIMRGFSATALLII